MFHLWSRQTLLLVNCVRHNPICRKTTDPTGHSALHFSSLSRFNLIFCLRRQAFPLLPRNDSLFSLNLQIFYLLNASFQLFLIGKLILVAYLFGQNMSSIRFYVLCAICVVIYMFEIEVVIIIITHATLTASSAEFLTYSKAQQGGLCLLLHRYHVGDRTNAFPQIHPHDLR